MNGKGSVTAAPDVASINIGATSEGRTAGEAMTASSRVVGAILKSLAAAGVAPSDIQTANVNLSPVWNNDRNQAGPRRITGYSASNDLHVRLREIGSLGTVLDQVTAVGANQIHSIGFNVDDEEALMDQARWLAVEDARRKACVLAEAAGAAVGKVRSIAEQGGGAAPMGRMMRAESTMAVPIAEGELIIEAQITAVFALEFEKNTED